MAAPLLAPADGVARRGRLLLNRGARTTIYHARYEAELAVAVLPGQERLEPWCRRNGVREALVQGVLRARTLGRTGAEVPFFNLSGTDRQSGQTVRGKITFLGSDSVAVGIGTVEFRLLVDREGRLLGGGIPAQNLVVERTARRS